MRGSTMRSMQRPTSAPPTPPCFALWRVLSSAHKQFPHVQDFIGYANEQTG